MPTLFRDDPADAPSSLERSRARALRHRMTEPEKRLWRHLRQCLPLERTHFRRQVPIEGYVVDFCCLGARLVVEVDGNQHGFDAAMQRDAARTQTSRIARLSRAAFQQPRGHDRHRHRARYHSGGARARAPHPRPLPARGRGDACRRKQGRMMATGSHLPSPLRGGPTRPKAERGGGRGPQARSWRRGAPYRPPSPPFDRRRSGHSPRTPAPPRKGEGKRAPSESSL